jgi:prepilin-type N-terminal cleavage/methylation domain-containing protein
MSSRKAFTLVEILIVVVILGILAAVVLPRFSNASATARASMLADDLRLLRTQIPVYQGQHLGVAPGYPNGNTTLAPTGDAFVAQITQVSDESGQTVAPALRTREYRFGPYMSEIPVNPINGKNTVQVLGPGDPIPAAGDDSHGWIYQPSTLIFRADCSASDSDGKPYYQY